ncbi:MAG: hypothetical protein C4584_00325 [Armatimonadetes bacterium]|nr:MAG: hypothetical protein C4584_00325 [Armatimonadota bacterium]
MPRASKVRLEEKELKNLTEHFCYLVSSLTNSTEAENFLHEFLTKEEKIMLTKRLVLFMMLKRNYPDPIIKGALKISYETIRTYKNQFPSKNEEFQKTINKLVNRERAKELFEKLNKLLKPLDLALQSKSNMKARSKFASGNWD